MKNILDMVYDRIDELHDSINWLGVNNVSDMLAHEEKRILVVAIKNELKFLQQKLIPALKEGDLLGKC